MPPVTLQVLAVCVPSDVNLTGVYMCVREALRARGLASLDRGMQVVRHEAFFQELGATQLRGRFGLGDRDREQSLSH